MIKRFLEIKRKYRYIGGAVFLGIICLVLVLVLASPKKQAPVTDVVLVPVSQTSFSISLDIEEESSYAGIEFALRLSDGGALEFDSFAPGPDGAVASPFMAKDELHYFGYYNLTGTNGFPGGKATAGTLYFTDYTSDKTLTVSVERMNVVRVDENKKSVTTERESPSYVFTVQREAG